MGGRILAWKYVEIDFYLLTESYHGLEHAGFFSLLFGISISKSSLLFYYLSHRRWNSGWLIDWLILHQLNPAQHLSTFSASTCHVPDPRGIVTHASRNTRDKKEELFNHNAPFIIS